MAYKKGTVADVLLQVDLGSSIAEQDDLLGAARVETSVFFDLLTDRVDLVPGTKGSGKSALYRIFVEILAPVLLAQNQVVIAHGVQSHGDNVFMAFHDRFERLTEDEFVDFWCIYLASLAHEQFVKSPRFADRLEPAKTEVDRFRSACAAARIPEIAAPKSLRDILEWVLNALPRPRKLTYIPPDGSRIELDLFGEAAVPSAEGDENVSDRLPRYVGQVKEALEAVLARSGLRLWLMVDRLDELFPRRSDVETRALRGLLRTLRIFESKEIRVKVFLRDDILEQVTSTGEGFTALTHVTARKAATLRWLEDDVLTLIVNRLFVSDALRTLLSVETSSLRGSRDSRREAFYKVFPDTVYSPPNQSATLRWIVSHTADGKGVVTPRDVIELLTAAKQRQIEEFRQDPDGTTDYVIGSAAVRFGLETLSINKRDTVLRAELPHLWPYIERFIGQKTEYSERAIRQLIGDRSEPVIKDLVSIGFVTESRVAGERSYKIPFLYRRGLELTQGRQE
jgi:hypothetical protein